MLEAEGFEGMNTTQTIIAIGFTALCAVSLAIAWRVIRSTSEKSRRTPRTWRRSASGERLRDRRGRRPLRPAGDHGLLDALRHERRRRLAAGERGFLPVRLDDQPDRGQGRRVRRVQLALEGRPARLRHLSRHGADRPGAGPGNRPGSDSEFGQRQDLVWTFDEPGTYEVLCPSSAESGTRTCRRASRWCPDGGRDRQRARCRPPRRSRRRACGPSSPVTSTRPPRSSSSRAPSGW